MNTVPCHPGAKSQRVCWLGSTNYLFTFGFSKQSEREIKIWDPKNLAAPVRFFSGRLRSFSGRLRSVSGRLLPRAL